MATANQVQALYIAYFGRPADSEGLTYWTEGVGADRPLEEIADGFAVTPEYEASIEGETLAQIINDFYVNLFGRNAEVEGLNFWVNEVSIGNTTTQQVGLVIGQAAVNADPANSDTVAIESKFTAANQWTAASGATTEGIIAYSGADGVAAGVAFLTPVLTTETVPTVEATETAVNDLIAGSGTGGTLDLTVFTDIADSTGYTKLSGNTVVSESGFKLNGENQTINAELVTLNAADILADSSTVDEDVLNLTLAAAAPAAANAATFQNIENVNVSVASYATAQSLIGAGQVNMTGVDNITVTGTTANGAAVTLNAVASGATNINTTGLTKATTTNATNAITVGTNGTVVNTGEHDDNLTLGGSGTGADTVNLGSGTNVVNNAGFGNDTIVQDAAGAGALGVVLASTGTVTLTATTGTATVTNGGAGARTVAGGDSTVALNVTTGASGDTVTTGSAADIIATGAGADTVISGAGIDTVNASTGADTVTLGAGADTYTFAAADSVDTTAATLTANLTAGDTLTFGNGLDIITDFTAGAGGDNFASGHAGAPTAGIGVAVAAGFAVNTIYIVSGNYDTTTNVFTVAASGAGLDTLVIEGTGTALSGANDSMVLLDNVIDTNLVAANFT